VANLSDKRKVTKTVLRQQLLSPSNGFTTVDPSPLAQEDAPDGMARNNVSTGNDVFADEAPPINDEATGNNAGLVDPTAFETNTEIIQENGLVEPSEKLSHRVCRRSNGCVIYIPLTYSTGRH
jgi:hypothetical protein